jgi:hypothetical protein
MEKRKMEGQYEWQQYVLNREELEVYCIDTPEDEILWAVLEIFPEEKSSNSFFGKLPYPANCRKHKHVE